MDIKENTPLKDKLLILTESYKELTYEKALEFMRGKLQAK
jgi:hypothetical protein